MKRHIIFKSYLSLGVAFLFSAPALGSLTGDTIDHFTSAIFHGPPGPTFDIFDTGPGVPLAPLAGPLVVDITTSTIGPGDFWVHYAFGALAPPTPGPGVIETHDLEFVGTPSFPPTFVRWWASPGGAVAAFGGSILSLVTSHDVDSSGFGFDVGVDIIDTALLASGDIYIIQISDLPAGGSGPPAPVGFILMDEFIIPTPGAASLLVLGFLTVLGRRRRST